MIQDHPLKVYYPHGGKHFIATWWTHDEQNQIIVAKSLKALEKTLSVTIDRYPDFEVKEMWEVEIVAPPEDFCQTKKEKLRKTQVEEFFRNVVYSFSYQLGIKDLLPEVFQPCSRWKKPYKESDSSSLNDPQHRNCGNCVDGIKLRLLSKEEFYEKYHEQYEKTIRFNRTFVDTKALYSKASPAVDLNDLWLVSTEFGHHSYGARLMKVKETKNYDMYECLFYFYKRNEIDISKYKLLSEKLKEENKKLREEAMNKTREKYKKEQEERVQKILDIFK